ncbi:MAG: hypothetical protein H8E46_06445 [FCB group bacterium]|nr:hypothetical protein [FCB group bacterium]
MKADRDEGGVFGEMDGACSFSAERISSSKPGLIGRSKQAEFYGMK